MKKAIWNGVVIAESDKTVPLEGNYYFPPESIKNEYFLESTLHTVCPYKGTASYYDVNAEEEKFASGAWYYPTPKKGYEYIQNYVAFYPDVQITE